MAWLSDGIGILLKLNLMATVAIIEKFWHFAFEMALYLINHMPTQILKMTIILKGFKHFHLYNKTKLSIAQHHAFF